MSHVGKAREHLFLHVGNLLSKEEFLLLCMTSTFLKLLIMITFTNFFDVEIFPEAECYLELFFRNNNILRLKNALQIPNEL